MNSKIEYPSVYVDEYTNLIGKVKIEIIRKKGAFVKAITPVAVYNDCQTLPWECVGVYDLEGQEGYYILICKPEQPARFEIHRYNNPEFSCFEDRLNFQIKDFEKNKNY